MWTAKTFVRRTQSCVGYREFNKWLIVAAPGLSSCQTFEPVVELPQILKTHEISIVSFQFYSWTRLVLWSRFVIILDRNSSWELPVLSTSLLHITIASASVFGLWNVWTGTSERVTYLKFAGKAEREGKEGGRGETYMSPSCPFLYSVVRTLVSPTRSAAKNGWGYYRCVWFHGSV
jgi:hypothetical protein